VGHSAVMSTRRFVSLLCLVALAGCNTAGASSSSAATASPATSSTPSAAGSTAASSPPTQEPSATPRLFTSDHYGYTVSVPTGWTADGATQTWDGASPMAPGHDDPLVDQFTAPPRYARLWVFAAPTTLDLAAYATHTTDANAAEHPCSVGSQTPEKDEAVTIDGTPARLLTVHCGILVLIAVAIHRHTGFVFGYQDPNGGLSFDAEDRATFLQFLNGVRLAN
jgi:hypothetical protein